MKKNGFGDKAEEFIHLENISSLNREGLNSQQQ